MSNSEAVIRHIKKRKSDLVRLFGGKCCICGFDKYQEALEFHHVNPSEKEFHITARGASTKALEKQLEELKKCVMVCANCHRGIHAGRVELPTNISGYDENIAKELLEEKYSNIHQGKKPSYCPLCGAITTKENAYCAKCTHFLQRKAERPSREELKQLIRTKSFVQIGKDFGVSDNAIRKWCDSYNLPRKSSDIKKYTDEEWLNI